MNGRAPRSLYDLFTFFRADRRRGALRLLLLGDRHHLGLVTLRGLRCGRLDHGQAHPLAEPAVDLGPDVGVVPEELPGVLAALADPLAVERVPGARLLHHLVVDAEVQEVAFLADPLAV